MKRIFSILVMILFFGLSVSMVHAESVRAVVDTQRLRLGDSFSLRVIADFKGGAVVMPPMPDFRVSSRGTSTRMQMINGTTTREVESLYLLSPLRAGALTIPPITVTGRGGTWRTHPIPIEVAEGGTTLASDAPWGVSAELSTESPYVGESVIWTFRLQTAARFQNARLAKPSFEGFSSEALGEGRAFEQEIDGRRYAVHEMQELLIPQRPGTFTIDRARLSVEMVTGRSRRSADPFFDDIFGSQRTMEPKELTTQSLSLNVRPLPPYRGEAPFSGLVGQYTLDASLEKARIVAGDPVTLTLTIEGRGNIRDASAPLISLPPGIKHYSDTPVEAVDLGPSGWQGRKQFKTAIVPLVPGELTIPPISLVWFDPKAGAYRTDTTEPLSIMVSENKTAESVELFQGGAAPSAPVTMQEAVRMKGQDILPLKVDADAMSDDGPLALSSFLTWLAAPLGIFLVVFLALRRFRRDVSVAESLTRRAIAQVKAAEKAISDADLFYALLHSALSLAMGALSGRPVEGVTGDDIVRIVGGAGGSDDMVVACVAILETIESVRYGHGAEGSDRRRDNVATLMQLMREVSA